MSTLTLLAGERSIGGTQIAIEDQGARLIFDCGMAYDPAGDPFAHVRNRPHHALRDLLTLGLVPWIQGLYAQEYTQNIPPGLARALPPPSGPTAVALSHSHLDHSHLAGFIDPSIPLYASPATARIVHLHAIFGRSAGGNPSSFQSRDTETFSIGPMRVRFIPVDHDVGGARAMLIETSDGVIAYSGDLRLHGPHPEQTLQFARSVRESGARALILEGTRLFPPPPPAEDTPRSLSDRVESDVAPAAGRTLEAFPGKLGVVLLTPENGERVEAIARAAAAAGRTLLLDPESLAYCIAALGRAPAAPYAVWLPSSASRILAGTSAASAAFKSTLDQAPRVVSAAEIAGNPGDYLVRVPFADFADLLELAPWRDGGVILTANGAPLGPFDPAWKALEWWAVRLAFQIVDISSTGHASAHDLGLIAAHCGVPIVLSIHSMHPELMPIPAAQLMLPERGRTYDIARFG